MKNFYVTGIKDNTYTFSENLLIKTVQLIIKTQWKT